MFEIIDNYKSHTLDLKYLEKYINFVTKKLNIGNAIFNVVLVNDKEIHKINKEYRNIDRPTDVISFALEDTPNIKNPDFRILGDIYISVDTLIKQAELYNHSQIRELCFLTTHGMLHLLGYDHMNESDEKIMFKLQEDLLNEYQIQR